MACGVVYVLEDSTSSSGLDPLQAGPPARPHFWVSTRPDPPSSQTGKTPTPTPTWPDHVMETHRLLRWVSVYVSLQQQQQKQQQILQQQQQHYAAQQQYMQVKMNVFPLAVNKLTFLHFPWLVLTFFWLLFCCEIIGMFMRVSVTLIL